MVLTILTMLFGIFVGIPMMIAASVVNDNKKNKKPKPKAKAKKPSSKGTIEFNDK